MGLGLGPLRDPRHSGSKMLAAAPSAFARRDTQSEFVRKLARRRRDGGRSYPPEAAPQATKECPKPGDRKFSCPNFPVQRIGGLCPSPNQGSIAGSRDLSADLSADMSAVLSAVGLAKVEGLAEVEGLSKVEGANCPWIGWDQSGKMMGAR